MAAVANTGRTRGWLGQGESARRNGAWAVAQQIVNVGFAGLMSILLARALPIADFGVYSYATAIAGLGVAIMFGGIQALGVREFRTPSAHRQVVLSALFAIREIFALVVYVTFVSYTAIFGGSGVLLPTAIAALAVFARVLDAPELVFQADLRTRIPAAIRVVVGLVFFVARVVILLVAPDVLTFVALFVAEQAVAAAAIYFAYRFIDRQSRRRTFESKYTWSLFRSAMPLSLSSIANQVNLRADVLILQAIAGSSAVAVYSAAAKVSELLYFVPTAYMAATFPALLDLRARGEEADYDRALRRGFASAFYLGIGVVAVVVASADVIVGVLYGDRYAESAAILRIYSLTTPFVFMAAVLSKWIVAEGVLWVSFLRHALGAVAAVALNLMLVPRYGPEGAAWATVVSYVTASYLFAFASSRTRRVALTMTTAPATEAAAWVRTRTRRGVE